jgi:hypothetical protein
MSHKSESVKGGEAKKTSLAILEAKALKKLMGNARKDDLRLCNFLSKPN